MVDRGNCSFVTKTRNIQNAGGQVALIINHLQDYNTIFSFTDDGTGDDISITTILISELEGNILKDHMKHFPNSKIILSIDHKNEDQQKVTTVRLFFDPSHLKVYHLINDLSLAEGNLLKWLNFIPVYTFDLSKDTDEYRKYLASVGRCMCKDKYCEDFEIIEGRPGRGLLIEAIRQKCIYLISHSNNKKEEKMAYFDYMNEFYKNCVKSGNFTETCSDETLKTLFSKNKEYSNMHRQINQCFVMSFNMPESENTFSEYQDLYNKCKSNNHLDENKHFISKLMRKGLPLIWINENIFYGNWDYRKFIDAVCSSLKEGFKPEVCSSNGTDNEENFNKSNEESKSLVKYYSIIFLIVIGFIFANVAIFLICRRYMKRRIIEELVNKDIESNGDSKIKNYLQLELNTENIDISDTNGKEENSNREVLDKERIIPNKYTKNDTNKLLSE